MNKADIVNTVAIHMQPIIGGLEEHVSELINGAPCNVLVVIGVGDVQQYASNVPRETGTAMLADLLKRWKADLPDVLPENRFAVSPGFQVLLEELEHGPADERENARNNQLRYVADLEVRARR